MTLRALVLAVVLAFVGAQTGCGTTAARTTQGTKKKKKKRPRVAAVIGSTQKGMATWYGGRHHGGPTASGERFDKNKLTAAHRTLPMNTRVRVTHAKSGRSVVVRINDRGPYGSKKRIIDVSEAAAKKLGIIDEGVAPVVVEVVGR
jgi:rare lipoprotein A